MIVVLFLAGIISIADAMHATSRWRKNGVSGVVGLWIFNLCFAGGVIFIGYCIARTLFNGFFR
jgi:hypothetical protein